MNLSDLQKRIINSIIDNEVNHMFSFIYKNLEYIPPGQTLKKLNKDDYWTGKYFQKR